MAVAAAIVILAATRGPSQVSGPERSALLAAAQGDAAVREYLGVNPFDRGLVTRLDGGSDRVSFFRGPRLVLDVAVSRGGRVLDLARYPPGYVRAGSRLLNEPWVLALLGAVFLVATCVVPLASLRNLDALACVAFIGSIELIDDRLIDASLLAGYLPLLYLGGRCLQRGLSTPHSGPQTPLYEHLTRAWPVRHRTWILAVGALAMGLAVCVATVTSPAVGDVAVASMSGATDLLHGILPYGHITTDVVHGDTYPLLAYASYVPAALVWPVHDIFDNLDGALWTAAAASLFTGLALWRSTPGPGGLRQAIAWFSFAPAVLSAASGSNDLVVAAWLALALVTATRPGRSGLWLAIAGWVKLVPLFLLPLWASGRRRPELGRLAIAVSAVTLAVIVWLLALDGAGAIGRMVDAVRFQQQRGSLLSIWSVTGLESLRAAGELAAVAGVAAIAVHAVRHPPLGPDPVRLAALAAASIALLQLAAAYWSFAYVTWMFPALALALFAEPHRGGRLDAPANLDS